jgi:hypothetical protein
MSRDAYSYDAQDPRETQPRPNHHRSTHAVRTPWENPETPHGDARPDVSSRSSRSSTSKPERLDTPRAFLSRGRSYLLRDSELRSLGEIGTFRVVTPGDLAKYAYDGDGSRMERDLRRLKQASLVTDKTIEVSRKKALRIATLTKRGRDLLRKTNHLPEEQAIYHGLVKPKEAEHDAALYRMYQKEAARIERAGGKPVRVILDYELKRNLNRELALLQGQNGNTGERERIAELHSLRIVEGKVQLPDLRIEYETEELEPRHIDLDLVTRDYRPRQVSEKARAGFALYGSADDAPRLRRILNDRDLTAQILSL